MKNVKNFEVFLNENKVADKDIEKEIKLLQKENPKGYAAEIKKLKLKIQIKIQGDEDNPY